MVSEATIMGLFAMPFVFIAAVSFTLYMHECRRADRLRRERDLLRLQLAERDAGAAKIIVFPTRRS